MPRDAEDLVQRLGCLEAPIDQNADLDLFKFYQANKENMSEQLYDFVKEQELFDQCERAIDSDSLKIQKRIQEAKAESAKLSMQI